MSVEFLFIGDTHLEKLAKHGWSEKQGLDYQFIALRHAYKYAVENGIGHIIIPGDIFETATPKQSTIRRLAIFLGKCDGVRWHLTRGNHDYHDITLNSLEVMESYGMLGALKHVKLYLSPELVELDGIPILFMSYPYHDISRWLRPKDFGIVVPHLEFKGAMRDSGHVAEEGRRIPKGVQQWVSGHLHTKQIVGDRLVYPGTMIQLNVVEHPDKFMLRTRVEGETVEHTFVPYTPPCRLFNMVISSEADFEKVDTTADNHRYRLVIKRGVVVPKNVIEAENVIGRHGYKNKADKERAAGGFLELRRMEKDHLDPVKLLRPYLERKGVDEDLIREAVKEAKKILSTTSG